MKKLKQILCAIISLCMIFMVVPEIDFKVNAADFTDTKLVNEEWEKTVSQFFGETSETIGNNNALIVMNNPNNTSLHIYLGNTNHDDYVSFYQVTGTDRLRFTSDIPGTFTFVV